MSGKTIFRLLIAGLIIGAAVVAFIYRDRFDVAALQSLIRDAGPLAAVIFLLIYLIAPVLFLPGSVLTLAGGALFGPIWGTLYSLIGATLGASLAFLVARYLASDWVAAKSGGRLKQLIEGVEREGWRFVAFVRLVPLFPFNLLNYALGLTRIRVLTFAVTSFICMFPGTLAYTYIGYVGREALTGEQEGLIRNALIALALLAAAVFIIPRVIRHFRKQPMPSDTTDSTANEQS